MKNIEKIEISSRTIIFTVLFLILLKLLWMARDVLFSLFIAFIVMSAVKPAVTKLKKIGIPNFFAVLIVFLSFLSLIIYGLYWFLPPFISEVIVFIKILPQNLEKLLPNINDFINFSYVTRYLPDITNQFFNLIKNVFSNAVFLISTIFFSFYFTLEEDFIKKFLVVFFEEKKAQQAVVIFEKIEKRLQSWFWGELILMMIVGVLTYIGLNLIGIKHALFLAVIAGLLEVVPNIGPVLSTIPALIVALGQSYFLGLSVLALYFIVQQLENNLIVPVVMKNAVGLNPIITLVALLIGGRVGGALGVLLAIPLTLFIETLILEIIKNQSKT
ncbi:MAG: AI-2E family transporter [Microgenomates group bacterium]